MQQNSKHAIGNPSIAAEAAPALRHIACVSALRGGPLTARVVQGTFPPCQPLHSCFWPGCETPSLRRCLQGHTRWACSPCWACAVWLQLPAPRRTWCPLAVALEPARCQSLPAAHPCRCCTPLQPRLSVRRASRALRPRPSALQAFTAPAQPASTALRRLALAVWRTGPPPASPHRLAMPLAQLLQRPAAVPHLQEQPSTSYYAVQPAWAGLPRQLPASKRQRVQARAAAATAEPVAEVRAGGAPGCAFRHFPSVWQDRPGLARRR